MKRFFFLPVILFVLVGCSGLPRVYPTAAVVAPPIRQACAAVFPGGKWQLLHSIEATLPGGRKGFVMGLSVVSSVDRSVHCVIMTMEGLVLFDAAYDGRLAIKRAVDPFDSKKFAAGLINDIRLIFFRPGGVPVESGRLKSGASVCRYRGADGWIVDVIARRDGSWEVNQYDRRLREIRTVRGYGPTDNAGIFKRIELVARGLSRYALVMDLVEALPLDP